MGTDLSVVNAARVSFDKESSYEYKEDTVPFGFVYPKKEGDWLVRLSEKDQKLIKYLAKHNHWSPFAHTALQFRIKAPIFVARQLVKHQVGGVWNEVSRRYVDSEPEFYFPDIWRGKPVNSKQGSYGKFDPLQVDYNLDIWSRTTTSLCLDLYNKVIKDGLCPEQARMFLPLNTMTEWIWTGSLYFFARVCNLRLDPHAQKECRDVAQLLSEHCSRKFPESWKVLVNVKNND